MADRYRGAIYVGVTSHLSAQVRQHRCGQGSDFCAGYGITNLICAERGDEITCCVKYEKRLKRWGREWKFALIKRG